MKAIILAAGMGSRLRPITLQTPKCLVKVYSRPILDYQLDALISSNIKEIYIVVGYKHEQITGFLQKTKYKNKAQINIILNTEYANTNNMYSLYLAKDILKGQDFLLLNGDVVVEPGIIRKIVKNKESNLICVDTAYYDEESMKVTIDSKNFVNNISKHISNRKAFAVSIDIYKFSSQASKILFECITNIIEIEKNLKEWTEVALQRLLINSELKMKPINITGMKWAEIDDYFDLLQAYKIFSTINLREKKVLFFDLDGTIYLGNKLINGADKLVKLLRKKGKKVYFISNNSSKSKTEYVNKLRKFNISVSEKDIILSTDGVINYLKSKGVKKVYVLGTHSLVSEFKKAGIIHTENDPEYVVVGYDKELTYKKLAQACIHIMNGVKYICTHSDLLYPSEIGFIPDAGSILNLIKTATRIKPHKVFGKPNPEMIKHIIDGSKILPQEVVIIGDRIYTDLKLASNLGCDFICVLSGETNLLDLQNLKGAFQPSLVINNVSELKEFV